MEIHEDLSKAEKEVGHYYMINVQEADPEAVTFFVPAHWHKVR